MGGGVGAEQVDPASHPTTVGPPSSDRALGIRAAQDQAAGGVHDEQVAGAQTTTLNHVRRIEIGHADFGARDHQVVAGNLVAAGAEPIAVQRGTGDHSVGERQGGRAIPRLHQAGVELIEVPQGGVHVGHAFPRLRHEHHQGVRRVAARADQELQCVVETRRVTAVRPEHGLQVLDVPSPHGRLERRLETLRGHL